MNLVKTSQAGSVVKDVATGKFYTEGHGAVLSHLANGGKIAPYVAPAVTQEQKDAQTLPMVQARILVEERLRLAKLSKHKKAQLSVDADEARLVEIDAAIEAIESL